MKLRMGERECTKYCHILDINMSFIHLINYSAKKIEEEENKKFFSCLKSFSFFYQIKNWKLQNKRQNKIIERTKNL